MTDLLEKLFKAIPEASYDLISRMIPGGIIVAASMSANFPILPLKATDVLTMPGVFVFLALSYVVGLAISSFIFILHIPTWFVIYPILLWLKPFSNDTSQELNWNPFVAQTVLDRIHDKIKQKSAEERPVVIKLFSEVSLLYGLTISFAIALCIVDEYMPYPWAIPVIFFLAGIFRSVRTWCRHASIDRNLSGKKGSNL